MDYFTGDFSSLGPGSTYHEGAKPGEPARSRLVFMAEDVRLRGDVWRARANAHRERCDALTAGHRARRQRHERHPVEDFLWTYYSLKPNELRRWHPGAGVVLDDAAHRADWRYYAVDASGAAQLDVDAYFARRAGTVDYVERLLEATQDRPAQFGCFGLHEWAMVYHAKPHEVRHVGLPLRIGHDATDAVVETHRITCTHFDAYRFFTPDAASLNTLRPTRETQVDTEQAGCLHAGMDLYKWASKLGPIVPGELLLDTFVLARDIREVDMRASPYDVSGYCGADGQPLAPIAIELADGKREYAALQRDFAARGNALRTRLIAAITAARAVAVQLAAR